MAGVRIIGIIAVAACLLAVVAFVLVVIAWAKPEVITDDHSHEMDSSESMDQSEEWDDSKMNDTDHVTKCPNQWEEKVYLFAAGTDWAPYEYLTTDGDLVGFGLDVMRDVCHEMDKKCHFYAAFDYNHCLEENTLHSEGLFNRWFDACLSYVPTADRLRTYSIFAPYFKVGDAFLYVTSGSNINNVGSVDFSNHIFGFLESWYISPACIRKKYDVTIPSSNARMYDDENAMIEDLRTGVLDIVVLDEATAETQSTPLRSVGDGVTCQDGDAGIITRKDNLMRLWWFAEGLDKIKANGRYAALCEMAKSYKEGDRLLCV